MAPRTLRTATANRLPEYASNRPPEYASNRPQTLYSSATAEIGQNSACSAIVKAFASTNLEGECEVADLPLPDKIKTWSSLPVDIKYYILAKLSYLDLYRAKTQSKEFKSLIESSEFHGWRGKVREGLLTALYFFVRNGIWYCAGYNLISKAWMRLPPFINLPHLDPDSFKDHSICAAGCLICANVGKAEDRLIVFNPLTGTQKELPHLVNRRFPVLMHMIVDAKEESYKLIVAGSSRVGDEHLSKTTEVYDSQTKTWKLTDDLPGPLFALNEHQTGVYINGILYCIAFLEGDRGKGLLAYSVTEEKWRPDLTRPLPYSTSSNIVQLLESGGEVYLFSEIEQERRVEHRIDVLDQTLGEWKNVMTETKVGNPGLQTYPEHTCVSFGEGKLCVYNTIQHNGVVYEVTSGRRCETLAPPARSGGGEMGFFSLNPLSFAFGPSFDGVEP